MRGSAILLLVAAGLVGGAAASWFAAADSDAAGVIFYSFAATAPLVAGAALVIAASRRPDVFGRLGLGGAIVVLVSSVMLSFPAILGLVAIAVGVGRRQPVLLGGVLLSLLGLVGVLVGGQSTERAYVPFLTVTAIGLATTALGVARIRG